MKKRKCYLEIWVSDEGDGFYPNPQYHFSLFDEKTGDLATYHNEAIMSDARLVHASFQRLAEMRRQMRNANLCVVSLDNKPEHHFHVEEYKHLSIIFREHSDGWNSYYNLTFQIDRLETSSHEEINAYLQTNHFAIDDFDVTWREQF